MVNLVKKIVEDIKALDVNDSAYIEEYEILLSRIADINIPVVIEHLIPLFDDEFEYDEIMYSIIHIIEGYNDIEYCSHLLKTLPSFIYKSPRWASVVHMRIMNSKETLEEYIKVCQKASLEQKRSIKLLLEFINKEDLSFFSKTTPLLEVL